MSSRVRQALSVALLTIGLLAAPACDHESLSGGTQTVTFSITPGPTGIGRYTSATWIVRKIRVLPADPSTAALYSPNQLLTFFSTLDVNLAATQGQTISTIALAPGNYVVSYLEVTPLVLLDEDLSPNPATCIEGIGVVDGTEPSRPNPNPPPARIPILSPVLTFTNPPYAFTVAAGQTTNLNMTVDVPGLIAGYESAFTCTLGCGPGGTPCLTAVNESTYRSAILANVSFE